MGFRYQWTTKHYKVTISGFNQLYCSFGRVIAGIHYGYGYRLPYIFANFRHACISQISRWENIFNIFIAACIYVESIYACFFQYFQHWQGFFKSSSAREVMLARNSEQNRHIRSYGASYGLHNFNGKPHSLFRSTAIFIFPLVPYSRHKLVNQISCMGMYLDCVKACIF